MTLNVGDTLTHDNFTQATPGTVITTSYGDRYVVLPNGYGYRPGWLHPLRNLADGGRATVHTVGDDMAPPLNAETFKQMVATVCIGSARAASVRVEPVWEALEHLNIPRYPEVLAKGMWVHGSDSDLIERFRSGHAVYAVGDPNMHDRFAAWRGIRGTRVCGGMIDWFGLGQVVEMPDGEPSDIYTRPPTAEDAAEIARLRGQVWVLGERAKRAERWCPAFEIAVGILGVTPASVTAETLESAGVPGRVISDYDTLREYPAGAIFQWSDPAERAGSWCWLVGRNHGRTVTRNLMGPNSGHHGLPVTLVWDGRQQMLIPMSHFAIMEHLPVGSRVSIGLGPHASVYAKVTEAEWRAPGSTSAVQAADFWDMGANPPATTWSITHIPGVNNEDGSPLTF